KGSTGWNRCARRQPGELRFDLVACRRPRPAPACAPGPGRGGPAVGQWRPMAGPAGPGEGGFPPEGATIVPGPRVRPGYRPRPFCAKRRLPAAALAVLLLLASYAGPARAAPLFFKYLGSYDITNVDTKIANDFHTQMADGRAFFKVGSTNTIPGSDNVPWFKRKVIAAKDASRFF